MANLTKFSDPLEIIKSATTAKGENLITLFMDVMQKLYQYELFKPMMDLASTLCATKRLVFIIEPKEFYMLDEGNCVTIEAFGATKQKRFRITIRKIKADVIIHEIGHMIEKESDTPLNQKFIDAVVSDIKKRNSGNLSLLSAIDNVMIKEVANYPHVQKASELFTRYFQLLSMSKEVAGLSAEYGYTLAEMYKAFPNLENWLWDNFYPEMISKIDAEIAQKSSKYIIPISEIKHKWAGEKVESTHQGRNKPKWSANFKSIKDDN